METEFEIGTNLTIFFLTEEDDKGVWFTHGIRKEGKCRQAHTVMVEDDDYPPEVLQNIINNMTFQNHIMSRKRCYRMNDLTNRMEELSKYDRE